MLSQFSNAPMHLFDWPCTWELLQSVNFVIWNDPGTAKKELILCALPYCSHLAIQWSWHLLGWMFEAQDTALWFQVNHSDGLMVMLPSIRLRIKFLTMVAIFCWRKNSKNEKFTHPSFINYETKYRKEMSIFRRNVSYTLRIRMSNEKKKHLSEAFKQ